MVLYKQWQVIYEIGQEEPLLSLVLASIYMSNPGKLGERLIRAFPECFSETQAEGPRPMSVIKRLALEAELAMYEGPGQEMGFLFPASNGILDELCIPTVTFQAGKFPEDEDEGCRGEFSLPEGVSPEISQGNIFEWQGTQLVVMENNEYYGVVHAVPVECVALDR